MALGPPRTIGSLGFAEIVILFVVPRGLLRGAQGVKNVYDPLEVILQLLANTRPNQIIMHMHLFRSLQSCFAPTREFCNYSPAALQLLAGVVTTRMPKALFSWTLSECPQRGATQLRIGRWFQGTWNAHAARFSDAGMNDAAIRTALKRPGKST